MADIRLRRPVAQSSVSVTKTPYVTTDIVKKDVTVILAHTQVESEDRSYDIDDIFVKIAAIEAENPVQYSTRRLHRAL